MARPSFEQAKLQYRSRYTLEHIPHWASRPDIDGLYYAPHYKTDLEWYENSSFPGEGKHGSEAKRFCISMNQSWPLGQRLTPKQAAELLSKIKKEDIDDP